MHFGLKLIKDQAGPLRSNDLRGCPTKTVDIEYG